LRCFVHHLPGLSWFLHVRSVMISQLGRCMTHLLFP
jgi:hypothetical protein